MRSAGSNTTNNENSLSTKEGSPSWTPSGSFHLLVICMRVVIDKTGKWMLSTMCLVELLRYVCAFNRNQKVDNNDAAVAFHQPFVQ